MLTFLWILQKTEAEKEKLLYGLCGDRQGRAARTGLQSCLDTDLRSLRDYLFYLNIDKPFLYVVALGLWLPALTSCVL